MQSARHQQLNHSVARTLAALLGSVPVAVASGVAVAAALPLRIEQRYLFGSYAVIPIWVGSVCCALLASSARRAWLGLSAVLALALLLGALGLGLR